MHTSIKKWGNSAAVRLPAATLGAAGLAMGARVTMGVEEAGRPPHLPARFAGRRAMLALKTAKRRKGYFAEP